MKGIYAILDENNFDYECLYQIVNNMIDNKINIFQIRIKSNITKNKLNTISKIKILCKKKKCILLMNDNISIAKSLDLDGVHIGSTDTNIADVKSMLAYDKIIGVSCYNNINLAVDAEKNGASYISFGSLYKTFTKHNATKLEISTISAAKELLTIPICLIGGVNKHNINNTIKLNCDLIAISKGLSSKDEMVKITTIYND